MTLRKITLTFSDGWKIQEGDKYVDRLCWDEMLGAIAELTHERIGATRYPMQTKKEHAAYRRRMIAMAKRNKTIITESK